jgi:hypothetical protein
MTGETPHLSAGFDDTVIARVRPPRLTTAGRLVIALYTIAALVLSAWAMRNMDVVLVAALIPVGALVAAGVSSYIRGVVVGSAS